MKKRLKKKRRKQDFKKWGNPSEIEFRCQNCGKKLDVLNDYHWEYAICDVDCGMELYGLSYSDFI